MACEGEIFEVVHATVLFGDDVFDVKGMEAIMLLAKTAVFAAISCAPVPGCPLASGAAVPLQIKPGFRFQDGDYVPCVHVCLVFLLLDRCKKSLVALLSQLRDARLSDRISLHLSQSASAGWIKRSANRIEEAVQNAHCVSCHVLFYAKMGVVPAEFWAITIRFES